MRDEGLGIDPVGPLDQKYVPGRCIEDSPEVAIEIEGAAIDGPFPSLLPDDEQRRAGLVLPSHHVGGPE